ncbi:NAD-dependent epimerase/dehydratase family protein [Corallincola holothuriorum]|uniref:dTDP-4-dehydrorhamnose reductase n=1 Tax=Corallincola holothuriorum TaxID=2282215 RepID=A0A368NIA1_9GAMM|nr:sugar nucleotide-binding protein [Corallincola holothuriorum]RCU50292.1 NAD-dependent epimerase/dehydratase family protein [Corallincola holothuriorum]
MKAIITGANGTLGKHLSQHLKNQGWTVLPWDRHSVTVNDWHQSYQFLQRVKPDAIFHLAIASSSTGLENEGWRINHDWPLQIADLCRELNIELVFTSTAMVFSDHAIGPFTPNSQPDAAEGYGFEKLRAEQGIRHKLPSARIVRLGWQIDETPGGNNMLENLCQQAAAGNGTISASECWYPACSAINETVKGLVKAYELPGDTYMLDSNRQWTFFDVVNAIKTKHNMDWHVVANQDFVFDQRMQDPRLPMPSLREAFPALKPI